MSKDSYWFRHDAGAGRGLRLKKVQAKYGHWGKGVYWDVIEVLREQSEYSYSFKVDDLEILTGLIGCSDLSKFMEWLQFCIQIDLFKVVNEEFFSEVLTDNMKNWEIKKSNGSKGGRPKKTEPITETKPKAKPKPNLNDNLTEKLNKTIREDKIREELINSQKEIFDRFRKLYPGTKRGNDTEFENLTKKHKEYSRILPILLPSLEAQIADRETRKKAGVFVAEWKNLKTWINQKCWEEIIEPIQQQQPGKGGVNIFADYFN